MAGAVLKGAEIGTGYLACLAWGREGEGMADALAWSPKPLWIGASGGGGERELEGLHRASG